MTMYEDQGQNIINTLLGAKEKTVDFGKQQDKLNDSIKKMDANPAVKFQKRCRIYKLHFSQFLVS